MEERLIALEVRYTHVERQLEELNHVVFEQQKLVDRLIKEMTVLRATAGGGVKAGTGDEPPPHY